MIELSKWSNTSNIFSNFQLWKSYKLSFSLNNKIASTPLDKFIGIYGVPHQLIISKIWSTMSFSWMSLYPLRQKFEFFCTLLKFQKLVKNEFFITNQGISKWWDSEFQSKNFITHLDECGIRRQMSCPETPKQHRIVEKKRKLIV